MISVGIRELKEKLSSYVKKASRGEEIVVTDHGKEVALVVPISRERRAVKALMDADRASWSGGKPGKKAGTAIKGKPLSKTIAEDRA